MPDDDNSGFEPDALAAIQGTAPKKSLRRPTGENTGDVAKFVERMELLQDSVESLKSDQKTVMEEAKSQGVDTKALRLLLKRRSEDAEKRAKREATEAQADEWRDSLDFYQ